MVSMPWKFKYQHIFWKFYLLNFQNKNGKGRTGHIFVYSTQTFVQS